MFTLSDHPQDRLEQLGAGALSGAELIALVLNKVGPGQDALGLASELITRFGGLHGLARTSAAEIAQVKGMSRLKAAQLKAAIELGQRTTASAPDERPQITCPADAARILMPEMSMLEQEHLRVMLLDTRNRVISIVDLYKGSLNTSMVRVCEIFREAIRRNCAAVIMAHNHPSGDPSPSSEDATLSAECVQAGKLLDIEVLDHLVFGGIGHGYVSMKERGLGFRA